MLIAALSIEQKAHALDVETQSAPRVIAQSYRPELLRACARTQSWLTLSIRATDDVST
jgi:hypothetical protein